MKYQDQLSPWVVHQLLPDLTQATMSRFRRRNEAESYLQALQHLRPGGIFAIAFEASVAGATEPQSVAMPH